MMAIVGRNNFPRENRWIFEQSWKCMWCGRNTANAQHHIVGRGIKTSNVERSILNCAWLCNQSCHLDIHGLIRRHENISMLLNITKNFLQEVGYMLQPIDYAFIKKYDYYYG